MMTSIPQRLLLLILLVAVPVGVSAQGSRWGTQRGKWGDWELLEVGDNPVSGTSLVAATWATEVSTSLRGPLWAAKGVGPSVTCVVPDIPAVLFKLGKPTPTSVQVRWRVQGDEEATDFYRGASTDRANGFVAIVGESAKAFLNDIRAASASISIEFRNGLAETHWMTISTNGGTSALTELGCRP